MPAATVVSVKLVPMTSPTWVAPRKTRYPATPWSSVLGSQLSGTCEAVTDPAARLAGADGGWLSVESGPCWDRTYDLEIKSLLLYQLS